MKQIKIQGKGGKWDVEFIETDGDYFTPQEVQRIRRTVQIAYRNHTKKGRLARLLKPAASAATVVATKP